MVEAIRLPLSVRALEAIAVKSLLLVVIVISCDAQPKPSGLLVGGAVAVAVECHIGGRVRYARLADAA